VIFGATLLVKLMDRYPVIITIGAGLIGWVAGEMLATDLALKTWLTSFGVTYVNDKPHIGAVSLEYAMGAVGVVIVVVLGKWFANKKTKETETSAPAGG
jgi:predicted tellurium resistance membrane protein TerC